jgi:hypothetical protein
MRESFGPRRGQKGFPGEESTQCGAGCPAATGSGCRTEQSRESPGGMSEAGAHPAGVSPLADEIRLDRAEAGQATPRIAEEESRAEAAGSRGGRGNAVPARGRLLKNCKL